MIRPIRILNADGEAELAAAVSAVTAYGARTKVAVFNVKSHGKHYQVECRGNKQIIVELIKGARTFKLVGTQHGEAA
ncbi:hypothetical protein [Photobacterium sp. 1_MG-2023]|uniref:hypothetical protein n=1 Tax=Photobacterium sp. 1_MG-2023 TaxID=3062646 RepID=UPI0026E186A5|nr:hypothetical protein [Photobacterium sp. 1_MG-2023]MDO6706760.1 hypothetical protein [Photobacterium sp. 1_MG-2023]